MSRKGQHIIHFGKLQPGSYRYRYEIDDLFFAGYERSEVKKGAFKVEVELNRQLAVLTFDFSLAGKANLMCDRCAGYFDMPLRGNYRLIVKFGEERAELSDELLVLRHEDTSLDVGQYLYEFIHLLLPPGRVHPQGQCDPETLSRLEALSPGKRGPEPDPRWEMLKSVYGSRTVKAR